MKRTKSISHIITTIFIFASIFIPIYIFSITQKENKLELYFKSKVDQENLKFERAKNTYKLISRVVFDNIINNKSTALIIKKANDTKNIKELSSLRKQLYDKLLPLYKNLKKQGMSQLQFHLKNDISFLRFHRPKRYGDSLTGIRYSVDLVNKTKKPLHGFEIGRVFNGFRHIFPILYNNQFVGTVEFSYAFDSINKEALELKQDYYAFILKKDMLEAKIFPEERGNYVSSSLSDKYLQNRSDLKEFSSIKFNRKLIDKIDKNIAKQAEKNILRKYNFLLYTKVGKSYYTITFIPIKNIKGEQVAYYISYQSDLIISQIENMHKYHIALITFMAALFSIFAFLYLTFQEKASLELEILATTDNLTKIANRNKFSMVMDRSIQLALRYDFPLSFIFFDIDFFKKINDTLGHKKGDEVLIELSSFVSQYIRSSDLFARWGGEEFIIILNKTDLEHAYKLAQKLRVLIENHTFVSNIKLTCSFGVTQLKKDDTEITILKRVDSALYSAKEQGRNLVVKI